MKRFLIILITFTTAVLSAEVLTYPKVLQNLKGIEKYEDKKYDKAAQEFQENALQHPNNGLLQFNAGNAYYKQGDLEKAKDSYQMALKDGDLPVRSEVYQNLGNVNFQEKKFKEAIKNYRQALQANPQNMDARYNYELAARMLQKQQKQQKQQNQNQDQEQEQDKQQNKNKQQKQQQQDEKKQEKQKQQQQQQQQEEKKKSEQQKQQQQEIKPEEQKKKQDAEKLLKALLQKEKEEQKKAKQKLDSTKKKTGKYW